MLFNAAPASPVRRPDAAGRTCACRSHLQRVWRWLALCGVLLLPGLAHASFTITRTSAPLVYIDTGDSLFGHYTSYQVTSSAVEADVWVGIGSFTGGVVSMAPNASNVVHFGPMAAGETRTAYFYLQASGTSASAQGHTVSVYSARPPGTALASSVFSLSSVESTIAANANKVVSTVTGPDPAGMGGVVTMTVSGQTGTLGSAGILSFTPAAYTNWRADVYELFGSSITLPSGTVLSDRLYTSGQTVGGNYSAVYQFRAVGVTSAPTTVSPVGYISSGTQIKHTSTADLAALAPITPPSNTLTLAKTVSPTAPNGGDTLTYTVRATNSGTNAVSIDRLVDSLPSAPATPAYVNGSASWGGAALADPAVSGSTLTWSGVFTVPASSTRDLVFQVVLPSTSGTYVNSVIGYIGTTQIDTTLSTSDNSPATATVTIGPDLTLTKTHSGNFTQGQSGSYTITVSNGGNAASSGTVTVADTLPSGMTPASASGSGWACSITGQTVSCTRSDALAAGQSYPAITLAVNVAVNAGTPLVNSASVAGGGDANTGNNSVSDSTTINPVPTDMSVAISGLAAYAAPAGTLSGNLICSNIGPVNATSATCTASVGSGAAISVGSCTASSGSAASLPAGATLTCPITVTAPGTAGGTDTSATSLTVSATTSASNDATPGNDNTSAVAELVDALNDSASLPATGGSVVLLSNDSLGSSAATLSNVGVTLIANGGITGSSINGSGELVVPGGTTAGSYSVTYRICAVAAPAVCDSANVAVTVATPADMGVAITGLAAYAAPGSTVTATVTCTNLGGSTASNASCAVSGLPLGATTVCTPASPQATLAAGAAISCAVSFTAPANGSVSLAASTVADGDAGAGGNNSSSGSSAVIDAVADSASLPASGGSVALLGNDTLGASAATPSTVAATITANGGLAGLSIDASGNLVVPSGAAAGSYNVSYQICVQAATTVCDSAIAAIAIASPADMAVAITGLPAYAAAGSTVTATLTCTNGGGSTASNATCSASGLPVGASVVCTPTSPQATLAAGGTISCAVSYTAPASGSVTLVAGTGSSSDASAGNNSASGSTTVINALADSATFNATGGSLALLANDSLGAGTATASTVTATITAHGGLAGLSIDSSGNLVVPSGSASGSYSVTYQICAIAAPSVCDSAVASVTVSALSPADMGVLISGLPAHAAPGSTVTASLSCSNSGATAATNASCDASGLPVGASVVCTPSSPQASLAGAATMVCAVSFTAPASGVVTLNASTSATLDANGANNSASAATAVIDAVADSATLASTGGTVALLANDTLGASAASPSNVVTTLTANGGLSGASIDAAGNLVVPGGSAAGSYSVSYRICAVAAPGVCDDAVASVSVLAAADMAVAISGAPSVVAPGGTVSGTVMCTNSGATAAGNATCGVSGLPVGASLACTPTSPQTTLAAGASISCAFSYSAPASGSVTLNAGTGADIDANPANNSANLSTAVIDAVADAASLPATGGSVPLLANDSLGAGAATSSNVTAMITALGGLAGASIDATGALLVPAGTSPGSYAVTYRICAVAAPSVCDSAVASVSVATAADMAVVVSGFPATTGPGASVTGTVVCSNTGGSPALNASCGVAGLPVGASLVCTPASPVASLAVGAELRCELSYTAPTSGAVALTATTSASNDTDSANGTATQTTAVIDATDDGTTVAGSGARVALLANDSLGSSVATPVTTLATALGSWPAGLTLDAGSGELVVAAGTPDGSYSLAYRLCATANPASCDTANVALTIVSADMAASISGLPATAAPGSTVSATLTCTNIGHAAALNASCGVAGLPAGATLSCTPPSPQATLAPGSAIVCTISFTVPATPGPLSLVATGSASNDTTPANNSSSTSMAVSDFRLDVVKQAGSPPFVQSGASSFDVSYRITVKAQGVDGVPNVQVADSLAHAFAAGSPSISVLSLQELAGACTTNPAYDGITHTGLLTGSDLLAAGASCTLELRARIAYASAAAVPASDNGNLAYASGLPGAGPNPGHTFGGSSTPVAPNGAVASDISNDSATPPSTANSDNPAGNATAMRLPLLATVTGSVFVDGNGNGLQDSDEVPKARYLVQVVQGTDPDQPAAGSTVLNYLQAVTAADGSYVLPGVPAGVTLALRFLPLAEGSGLTPATAVLAVPAGSTGMPVLGGTPTNGAPGLNTAAIAATRAYLPLRVDAAALTAGGTVPNQNLPIDPSGVVYDSVTREPVAGAIVQLQMASGAAVPAGTLLSGTSDTLTTNADGVYAFLLEASAIPGSYRLVVTPPALHQLSTTFAAAAALAVPAGSGPYRVQAQNGAPTGNQSTLYHLTFNFTQPRDVIHNHIPLDPRGGGALFIDKQADRRHAEIGDSISYRVRLRNPNSFVVPAVQVEDRLPLGFALIAGSTRLTLAGGAIAVAEPAGAPGPGLSFALGTLPPNAEFVLSYRVRVGLGADRGSGSNTARASGAGGALASRTAQATVTIAGGVFTREACVIGKVYMDCNNNALQDAGEPGIPGVRLVFEDGTALTTDTNGQYSLCGLRAITHVLKVDPHSLPIGSLLGLTGSRNAGDPQSRFVDLKAGELHRADFREASCQPGVRKQVEQRRSHAGAAPPPERAGESRPPGVRFDSASQNPAGVPTEGPK